MRRWPSLPSDRQVAVPHPVTDATGVREWFTLEGTTETHPVQPPCSSRIPSTTLHRIVSGWLLISPGKEAPEPLCPSAQSPSQYRSSSSCTEAGAQKSRAHSPAQWIYFKHEFEECTAQVILMFSCPWGCISPFIFASSRK